MADKPVSHFHNNDGAHAISIGVSEFMCIGATPPYDHPHIFLDMGAETEVVCPYCSTVFRHDDNLAPDETQPKGHLFKG